MKSSRGLVSSPCIGHQTSPIEWKRYQALLVALAKNPAAELKITLSLAQKKIV